MKNNNKKTLKKLAILVIGSIIAAYGITLALYAGFGGATLAVLWQGIARTFHIMYVKPFELAMMFLGIFCEASVPTA